MRLGPEGSQENPLMVSAALVQILSEEVILKFMLQDSILHMGLYRRNHELVESF